MLDVVCSTAPTIRIGGSDIPTEAVKDRFLQLDSEHIMIRKMGEHPEQYVSPHFVEFLGIKGQIHALIQRRITPPGQKIHPVRIPDHRRRKIWLHKT